MTENEVKAELHKYRKLCKECELLRKRLALKQKDIMQLHAVVSDGMPKGSGASDPIERAIEQIDSLTKYYAKKIAECEQSEMQVLRLIELVDTPDDRNILFMRYIEGKRFEDIAAELYIANSTMWKRYRRAIEKLCSEME